MLDFDLEHLKIEPWKKGKGVQLEKKCDRKFGFSEIWMLTGSSLHLNGNLYDRLEREGGGG